MKRENWSVAGREDFIANGHIWEAVWWNWGIGWRCWYCNISDYHKNCNTEAIR
jgi:hypothetical protein